MPGLLSVRCAECGGSTWVRTRQDFTSFEEQHRDSCGTEATIDPVLGGLDEVLDLPPY